MSNKFLTPLFFSLALLLWLPHPSLALDGMKLAIPDAALWGRFRFDSGLKALISQGQEATGSLGVHEVFAVSAKNFGEWKNLRRKKKKSTQANLQQKWALPWSCEELVAGLGRAMTAGGFFPETLFFFYKNPGEYVVAILGKIDPGRLRAIIAPERLMERSDGFAVAGTSPTSPLLRIGDGFALLCPTGFEGNVTDMLTSETPPSQEQYAAFRKMLDEDPTLALEISIGDIKKNSLDADIPFPLNNVELLRLMIGQKIMKIQAYAPNDQARIVVAQLAKSLSEMLQGKPGKNGGDSPGTRSLSMPLPGNTPDRGDKIGVPPFSGASFWMHRNPRFFTYGKSVFVDCAGLQDLTAHGQASFLGGLAALIADNLPKVPGFSDCPALREARK